MRLFQALDWRIENRSIALWRAVSMFLLTVFVIPAVGSDMKKSHGGVLKSSPASREVLVYDATLYSGKPDLSSYGVRTLPVIYQGQLWKGSKGLHNVPDSATIRASLAKIAADATIICIDIEHWPLNGDRNEVKRNLNKYIEVMRSFRATGKNYRMGYYGVLPAVDYWRAIEGPTSAPFRQWQSENEAIAPLAAEVDVLFPSLYTFYTDQRGWRRMAIAQIKAAKSYGKPVYVFLWPQFHNSNRLLSGRYIGDDYWRMELETVQRYADGIVIWGGWGDGKPARWDNDAPWWKVTKRFMKETRSGASAKSR